MNPKLYKEIFIPQITISITELVIQGIILEKKGISILGALYIEKVLRSYKQFIMF